jgi:hypothetical protein
MSFETYFSIMKLPTVHTKELLSLKAFIASLLLMLIAIKDHNTYPSLKTQLQRETLASKSLISTRVITLQLTRTKQQNNTHTKKNMFL